MAGIVVFSGPGKGFNERLQSTFESSTLFALPSCQWPQEPRWGVYAHAASPNLFTVLAVQNNRVLVQTGLNLAVQIGLLRRVLPAQWPRPSVFKKVKQMTQFKPSAAWVMLDSQMESFEWPCASVWGPKDIEAECRLEASLRLQIPASDLALDYEVARALDGQLWVKVWVCRQTAVDACVAQLHVLGLQLRVVTASSHLDELAQFFRHSEQAQQKLHQRIHAQEAEFWQQGQVVC
jgi:hypothetical protein